MFTVTGKLSGKSIVQSGISEKGAWKIVEFLIQKTRKRKPIVIMITAKGKLADTIDGIMVGDKLDVRFYIESVKYKDRYFNNNIAIEIEKHIPKDKYKHGIVTFGKEVYNDGKDDFTKDNNLFNSKD